MPPNRVAGANGMARETKEREVSAVHWLQYAAFRVAESILNLLPIAGVVRIGRFLGGSAYWITGKYRRLAQHNLRIAFSGEWSEAQIRSTARAHFATLGGNLLAGFKLPLMSEADILKRVVSEGVEHVQAADREGRNIVYAVCHLSCWELLTQVPSLYVFGRKPGSVFQPLANPLLNALVLRRRQKLGYSLFDRSEGFTEPMKFIRNGGCLGVLVDQHAGDHGVWCPFFGRLASTTPLAALLARRGNALLLPITIQDDGIGRWRLRILPPVAGNPAGKPPSIEQVTADLNVVVENVIWEKPADWFWVHNRWKTPNPNFLLKSYHRGIALPAGMQPSQLKPFEVVVRSPNWLGDACMALPAVRALKQGRPDIRVTVFGPDKLRDLWLSQGEVDAFVGKVGKEGLWKASGRLRRTGVRYDAGILFTNSTRSTLEFWLAGIPRLVGQRGSIRSWFLTQTCPESKLGARPLHHTEKYVGIVRHAGGSSPEPSQARPETEGAAGDRASSGFRLGLCAGAEYGQAKRWPMERFAAAASQISARLDRPSEWILFGAPGEAAMGEALSAEIRGPHQNRVGKTSLGELIVELRTCDLLLTNDTGTMHLAAALGVPTVSIFGSTEPSLTGPVGDRHWIVRHHVPCSPCFKRECPFGHFDCMTGITVERVVETVLEALKSVGNRASKGPFQVQ
jgi:heptosyltransferase-2